MRQPTCHGLSWSQRGKFVPHLRPRGHMRDSRSVPAFAGAVCPSPGSEGIFLTRPRFCSNERNPQVSLTAGISRVRFQVLDKGALAAVFTWYDSLDFFWKCEAERLSKHIYHPSLMKRLRIDKTQSSMDKDSIVRTCSSFRHCLAAVIATNGGHFDLLIGLFWWHCSLAHLNQMKYFCASVTTWPRSLLKGVVGILVDPVLLNGVTLTLFRDGCSPTSLSQLQGFLLRIPKLILRESQPIAEKAAFFVFSSDFFSRSPVSTCCSYLSVRRYVKEHPLMGDNTSRADAHTMRTVCGWNTCYVFEDLKAHPEGRKTVEF